MRSTTHIYRSQESRHVIPLEECLDIVLTSGILKRKGTITRPSSKVFSGGSSDNSSDYDQGTCSIQILDKFLAENSVDELLEGDDGRQNLETIPSSSSLSSSLSVDRVDEVIAAAQELTDVCITCINKDQNVVSHGSTIATTTAVGNDHLDSSQMKDLLSVNEVFTNFSIDRLQKLQANLEVLKLNLDDNT